MGQGCKEQAGGVNSQPNQAQPTFLFIPVLEIELCARSMFKLVSPAFVLKNKNLQHEIYSS